MLIVLRKGVDSDVQESVKGFLIERGFDIHQSTGANRVIIGVIGDTRSLQESEVEALPGVLQVVRIKEG